MYKIIAFFLGTIFLFACQTPVEKTQKAPILQEVAAAYGFQHFDKASKFSYTFNVQMGDAEVARGWQWWPKENRATLKEAAGEFSFKTNDLKTAQDSSLHRKFVNDKYWLLFPFHLVWDEGFTHEVKEGIKSPIDGTESTQLSIQYNQEDGYTPGDRYTLYLDKNKQITAWEFTKGGDTQPSLATHWEKPEEHNGIKVSLDHKNAGNTFRLWFTQVDVAF